MQNSLTLLALTLCAAAGFAQSPVTGTLTVAGKPTVLTCPVFCTNPIESIAWSGRCWNETFGCSLRLHLSFGQAGEDRGQGRAQRVHRRALTPPAAGRIQGIAGEGSPPGISRRGLGLFLSQTTLRCRSCPPFGRRPWLRGRGRAALLLQAATQLSGAGGR